MATSEEILLYFQSANIKPSIEVLDKCVELSIIYNISPEDLVDQWFAYTISNLNGAPPSLEGLDKMERKELQKLPKYTSFINKQSSAANFPNEETITEVIDNNTPKENEVEELILPYNASQRFNERSDSLNVLLSHGNVDNKTFRSQPNTSLLIKLCNHQSQSLGPDIRYMYEKMGSKARSINNITQWVADEILEKYSLEPTQHSTKTYTGEMLTYGRICSESTGKLNTDSILLEGTIEVNRGHAVKLNVDKLMKFALFPGQVAVVKGNNMKSNSFIVESLYTDTSLQQKTPMMALQENLQIVVASGPYTLPDNLLYEPLNELIQYVIKFKPNLLILIGPFIEANHKLLSTLNETFDSFFENLLGNLMETVQGIGVEVIVVPSHKDVHNQPIFPSPPFKLLKKKSFTNLFCAPSPCLLDVNGLIIGATSADILFHINKQEIYQDKKSKAATDRMGRLVSHILNQRSFYPLCPPDTDIRIDYQLLELYGMLDCLPHILILPSNLRYFIKTIENCLVINPERLVKGLVAGTFVRIEVNSSDNNNTICSQILRI